MIRKITEDKRSCMELLLIGDEQEDMILRYLDRCELYAYETNGYICGICAVTDEGNGVLEIKNIAVKPQYQRRGIGRELIRFIEREYSGRYRILTLGTGDSPLTVPFYERCGFRRSGSIPDFFTINYDHPIIEAGVQLRDMILFEKELGGPDDT